MLNHVIKNESTALISRVLFLIYNKVSAIYLIRMSPHGSSILPSAGDNVNRAGNPQTAVYMNLQLPDGTAGRSPDRWWSLTPPSHPYRHRGAAVVFFCLNLLSPIACIFTSGTPFAARTFLSQNMKICQRQTRAVLSKCKDNKKSPNNKTFRHFFLFFNVKCPNSKGG